MLKMWLSNAWDYVSLTLAGWKTHITAATLIALDVYQAAAQYWDWSKLITDPLVLMLVNSGLAALVIVFRQMANTASKINNA